MAVDADLLVEHLDVYDTKTGPWNPDHGEIEIPDGWELLPSGDAFLTRRVKAAGVYWVAWKPRSSSSRHRRLIGVWAPAVAIAAAHAEAEQTAEKRERARQHGAISRARAAERDRLDLEAAIIGFLDFADQHRALAREIAAGAAGRAAVVGSGRVGRTRTISLEERAALAARAYIRHNLTSYDDELVDREVWDDEFLYREVKRSAQEAVDRFLSEHR
jgi:hypothetical protein